MTRHILYYFFKSQFNHTNNLFLTWTKVLVLSKLSLWSGHESPTTAWQSWTLHVWYWFIWYHHAAAQHSYEKNLVIYKHIFFKIWWKQSVLNHVYDFFHFVVLTLLDFLDHMGPCCSSCCIIISTQVSWSNHRKCDQWSWWNFWTFAESQCALHHIPITSSAVEDTSLQGINRG